MKAKLYLFQRGSLFILCFIFLQSFLFSQQVAKSIPNATSPDHIIGFLQFTPSDYGSQKHPLIIFLHGIGERGNGTTQLNSITANAIPKFCAAGATMRFTVNGQTSSFVVLSPQLSVSYGSWPTYYVKEMIKYAKANLQIDTNRIYVCGLSLGGGGIWNLITEAPGGDYSFDGTIAAAAPVCGTQEETDANFCNTIGANHLPLWAFHSMDDGTVNVGATQHAQILAGWCNMTPAAKFTYYQSGGHSGAWIHAYDTGHITVPVVVNGVVSNFTANPNLYEWFLSNTRGTSTPPTNTAPIANAGSTQTITLPTNSVNLTGTGTGTNGATISSYAWVKTSGPAAGTISSPTTGSTAVTGLVQGTYVFTLTVTDNHGLTNSSSVTITVNAAANTAPIASAGIAQIITLPISIVTLTGTGTGTNGATIASYSWAKTSGPAGGVISLPLVNTTLVTGLIQGTYVFTLTVTDNHGLTNSASVTITVNAAANQPPVASAGSNASITLPTNSITLNGSASSDPDGTISTYAWTKTSGPASYTITNAGAATTTVTGLTQGVYTFTLLVTDNSGATASATVTITVNAAANQPPVANAGSNASITLPTNSTTLNGSASSDPDGTISTYAWTKTSGPASYTITNAGAATTTVTGLTQGVYTFTLQVTDNSGATASATVTITVNAAANQPPVANAGNNSSITLPTNSTTLNGSASSDPDGTISTYAWTKTSGPASYTITNAGAATTTVTGLTQGVYTFTLKVTDNIGATSSATVTITVNTAANQPPVANAGSNASITLPTNSTTLNGSASSDPDGTISTYAWTKTSGPASYTITNAGAATTTVTGLTQGVYTFTLQVTDNSGATASATVTITVNAAANQPPVANAGNNSSITLPTNSTTLNGSASSDPDGTISTYAWTKTSGPASYTITNAGAATTTVTGLTQGVYTFTLKVTDNIGATASSTVTITVNAAANQPPVANAGSNASITLPTNSTTLNGSASSDPDGTISTYVWTKTSGPASYTITNAGAATTTVTGLTQGVYTFTLKVTDNIGATSSATVTITVNAAANLPPIANAGNNSSITLPTNTATLNGSASSDPDGTISVYTWGYINGPASFSVANSALATTTVTNLIQGVYTFMLKVTDNNGASSSTTVTITVNAAPNQPPVANGGSNANITLPTNGITLNGSASNDPDGTISTYTWSKLSGPASYTIANASAASTAVTNLVQGVYTFMLQVTDNSGATDSASVTVIVNAAPLPANQSPIANAGSNSTITLPTNNTTLDGSASTDPDGTISTYAWTKSSGPATYSIANAASATTALSNLVQGIYVFTLKVTDNAGASSTAAVTITVNAAPVPVNIAPVADAGNDITIVLPVNTANLNGSASSDPDGTISAYSWTKTSGPTSYTIANAGAATTTVTNLIQGVYTFTLKVTDNAGASSTSAVTINVNAAPVPVNIAPIADAGNDINIVLPVNTANLNGSASNDPDGTISAYTWSYTSGPTSFNIANSAIASTTVTNLVAGVYVFTLKVTDNAGASSTSAVTITVNAAPVPVNQAPISNAGNDISLVLPDNITTLDGSASSDPDGTVTSYLWTETSGPTSYSFANAGAATTVLSNLVQGVYVFNLQVTDNAGASSNSSVTVTVSLPPNAPPVANAGTHITVTLPVNSTKLDGTGSYDPDGSIIDYSWNKISGPGAITIVNSNTSTPTVIGLAQGEYVFELTVTDNNGATSTDQVIVTVNGLVFSGPIANAGKDTAVSLPASSIVLSGINSSDTTSNIVTYQWKEISGPSTAIILQPGAVTTEIDSLAEGDYIFELLVTDSAGLSSTADVKVSVINNFRYSEFFKLYPNPATSMINLQFIDDKTGKIGILAYDVSGRLVINEEFTKDQSLLTRQINISGLKSGMYYLEIRHADGTKLVRPFVKQ